eukprot:GFUD01078212.1.p1 GENE.GFUD01078212.1~~GFUD01078212.1.p1  ORF type:complete len:348 (-),score=106.70 GFUD01078212.1:150-1193(-)
MVDEEGKSSNSILHDGSYFATGSWYSSIVVKGDTAVMMQPNGTALDMKLKFGEFGEADPDVAETTGQKFYNIKLSFCFGKEFTELGVVSEDGLRITTKNDIGLSVLEWRSEEEVATLEAKGDPIEAPPGPYKIQPDVLGQFLWMTGGAGVGKSTSAQLLRKMHGYVYYEGDCFASFRNPYIPPDVQNPSLAQFLQKPLIGEGLEERREVCKRGNEMFGEMMAGGDYDKVKAEEYYEKMCEDIKRERKRIGGDWSIAGVTFGQDLRNFIRSKLGPDLVFVVLNMEMEDLKERIRIRHLREEGAVDILMSISRLCEAATEDDDNAVNVMITNEMSKEDVISKILEKLNL